MTDNTSDTIVVGIDGTPNGDAALRWATVEARRSGRPLLIAHVWHWSTDALSSPIPTVTPLDARKAGAALLRRAATRVRREGIPVSTRLLEGSAPDELVELADGAAMLVLGPRPRRRITRTLFGSASREAVLRATCPVVLIPAIQATNHVAKADTRAKRTAT